MNIRTLVLASICFAPVLTGCGRNPQPVSGSAAIIGTVLGGLPSGKLAVSAQLVCPEILVSLNSDPATINFGDDCSFVIDHVQPSASYLVEVEVPDLGVIGTLELLDVGAGELIEILVDVGDEDLTISVVRRATPDPIDDLPSLIEGNNVEIFLSAGLYDTGLIVEGNNFTLVGEAGDSCDDEFWTVISGDVLVLGNNATFRNVVFEGSVQVEGNNASFINVCFGGDLIIFGNNTEFDGEDDGENEGGEDDDDGGGDDDDDGGDDDGSGGDSDD